MNRLIHTATGALMNGAPRAMRLASALARAWRWLAGLFAREPDREALLGLTPLIDPRFDAAAIENLLAAMRRQRIEVSDNNIQMVHFGALPQAVGRRWTAYVERAMRLSEGVLLKRLDLDDIFTRYADFAFLVVFVGIEDQDAPDKAEALSEDIQHRLLLDRELAKLAPVREVIARIIDLLGDKTPAKILKLAEALDNNARLLKKAAAKAGKTAAAPGAATAKHKAKPGKNAPAFTARAGAKSDNKFKMLSGQTPNGPGAALPDWMGTFSAPFRPMLHINNRVVGIHACIPQRVTPDDGVLIGEAVYPKGEGGDLSKTIDFMLARHALDELRLALGAENKTQVSTMTTLNSLATSSELKDLFLGLNEKEGKQLIIEIAGVRQGTPSGQLSESVGKLRGNVRSVNLLVGLRDWKLEPFADIGLNAIGCDAAAPELRNLRAEVIAKAMTRFVDNVKAIGLGSYFHGVDSAYLLDAATEAGVDFITGDAFEPAVGQPGAPRMLKD